ncbi:PREDICTED: resistance to inhibitors of cholinesterase protein 3-like [Priapulus caudatus]|uniref:Resistance to inhibitors of cholinesterase protein 3-like n=1 Tax=Priapulus caudatus TaxID=37621 RepID=A0ABM1E0A3_PRICU|nr:PREDICTED: resistance to inhibitors of cholinesterase protein 3-like [Priapulus caudatus]
MAFGQGRNSAIFVFAVVVGCFAILYPKIFYPIIKSTFFSSSRDKYEDEFIPPSHMGRGKPIRRVSSDVQRPPMHADGGLGSRGPPLNPAMRGAQEARKLPESSKSSMHTYMPVCAIGVIIFLLYTFFKAFMKREPDPQEEEIMRNYYKKLHYNEREKKFEYDDLDEYGLDPDYVDFIKKRRAAGQRGGQREDKYIGTHEMDELQKRLEETEGAMDKIMTQMNILSDKLANTGVLQDLERINRTVRAKTKGGILTKEQMQARLDRVMLQMQLIADVAESEQQQKQDATEEEKSSTGTSSTPDLDGFNIVSSETQSSPDMEGYEVIDKDHNRKSEERHVNEKAESSRTSYNIKVEDVGTTSDTGYKASDTRDITAKTCDPTADVDDTTVDSRTDGTSNTTAMSEGTIADGGDTSIGDTGDITMDQAADEETEETGNRECQSSQEYNHAQAVRDHSGNSSAFNEDSTNQDELDELCMEASQVVTEKIEE